MTKRKKAIPLGKEEDRLLRKIYVQWRIPRGQYKSHPEHLAAFVQLWSDLAGRSDSSGDVLHYIETKQKAGARLKPRWPVFNGSHKRLPPVDEMLRKNEIEVLRGIYEECILPLNIGTDKATFLDYVVELLTREFSKKTGRVVPGIFLLSRIESERKRGRWLTLRDDYKGRKDDAGFDDLDDVVGL